MATLGTFGTLSSIVAGTNSTTPLTINSSAGVQFKDTAGTTQLGNSCSISGGGVFNCNGLTINGPLTCSSIIISNIGTIQCLGSFIFNSELNMNGNAIKGVGGLTIASGGLSISSGGLSISSGGLTIASGSINLSNGQQFISSGNYTYGGVTKYGRLSMFTWYDAAYIEFTNKLEFRIITDNSSGSTRTHMWCHDAGVGMTSLVVDNNLSCSGVISGATGLRCRGLGSATGKVVGNANNWSYIATHTGNGTAFLSVIVPGGYFYHGYVSGIYNAVGFFVSNVNIPSHYVEVYINPVTAQLYIKQSIGISIDMYWTLQYLASTDYIGTGSF